MYIMIEGIFMLIYKYPVKKFIFILENSYKIKKWLCSILNNK